MNTSLSRAYLVCFMKDSLKTSFSTPYAAVKSAINTVDPHHKDWRAQITYDEEHLIVTTDKNTIIRELRKDVPVAIINSFGEVVEVFRENKGDALLNN